MVEASTVIFKPTAQHSGMTALSLHFVTLALFPSNGLIIY